MAKGKDQEHQQLARITDYKAVFGTPAGKRVLLDLMNVHGILAPMYNGDRVGFFIKEGQRTVVLRILNVLGIDEAQLRERINEDV